MNRLRHVIVAGLALLLGFGVIAQSHTYASSAHATKQILAVISSGKYAFSPAKTTVKVGTKVVWVNKGPAPHTVTSKTTSWKYDKKFTVGQKLSVTFKKAGTYHYYCKYHPYMTGTIVVK